MLSQVSSQGTQLGHDLAQQGGRLYRLGSVIPHDKFS
jgi:hypothetical protein